MDTIPPRTNCTDLSLDAIPLARTFAAACAVEGARERLFAALYAILRGVEPGLTGLPSDVVDAIPRFRALDTRSMKMVASFFGDIFQGGEVKMVNDHPYFIVLDTLSATRWCDTYTRDELRRLFDAIKDPEATVPTDLPPVCLAVGVIMKLLDEKTISDLERDFFGHDPSAYPDDNGGDGNDK